MPASVNEAVIESGQIIEQLAEKDLPEIVGTYGVGHDFGGRAAEQEETFADFTLGGALAAVMIYIILTWGVGVATVLVLVLASSMLEVQEDIKWMMARWQGLRREAATI